MVFDEKSLENLFMSKFEALGYEHVNGETIERDTRELILKDDLERYLRSKYADENLTDLEISMIMSSFQTLDRGDYVNNRNTFRSICDGFVFRRADKTKNPIWVELIDFKDVDRNIFKIVNQFEIQGPKEKRIPDAIVFINGIPLVILEFKSTVREDATLYDAFLQIEERYVRSIPDLFAYNAFTVISDGINSRIGTHFSKYEHADLSFSYVTPHKSVFNDICIHDFAIVSIVEISDTVFFRIESIKNHIRQILRGLRIAVHHLAFQRKRQFLDTWYGNILGVVQM